MSRKARGCEAKFGLRHLSQGAYFVIWSIVSFMILIMNKFEIFAILAVFGGRFSPWMWPDMILVNQTIESPPPVLQNVGL